MRRTLFGVWPGVVALAFLTWSCGGDSGRDENGGPGGGEGDATDGGGGTGGSGDGEDGGTSSGGSDGGEDGGSDEGSSDSDGMKFDVGGGDVAGDGGCFGDQECPSAIDLLFVIDNSGTMGEEQLNLARNFPLLIEQLQALENGEGEPADLDVNVMVTTTDFGNPLCLESYYSEPREPEAGAPIQTGCNARIARFTFQADPPVVKEEACTEVCPGGVDIEPTDPFIHFDASGDNVPDGTPAEALSCLGPQGIDGCGYEAPLETMLQALNPGSPWNDTLSPFLRDDAVLAVVIITDEADCSVKDYGTVMYDESFQNVDPDTGTKRATSAICWHAGVSCNGPNGQGVYTDCVSQSNDNLQPPSRYIDYLRGYLTDTKRKEVLMLGILGVPLVTEHADVPPYQPTAGGVFDLVYRKWVDGAYPAGDILPEDVAAGLTAAHKEFQLEIGPGCTGEDGVGGFTGQAIPPVRIKEVCESLNREDDPETQNIDETAIRCCIESICDTDFSAAIRCLTGIIQDAIKPQG